jgi:APA family basic amino acid/polyamine antiporter
MTTQKGSEELKRVIGIPTLAFTVINFSIGAGIYALPALICKELGPAAIIGYLLCGIMFSAIMLCYVEIGSKIKSAGGSYAYVEHAFGPLAGFVVNWLFFFGWGIISDAAVINIVADSLSSIFPLLKEHFFRCLLLFLLISLTVFVNIFNSKSGVRLVSIITVIKIIPLIAIIVFGLFHVQWQNLRIDAFPALKNFDNSAIILFFALAGFETSLNVSGEIKDPKKTIPRGILIGGVTVFIIYVLVQTVFQGIFGNQISEIKEAPLAAVAKLIFGPAGGIILLLSAALSGFNGINGDVFASPRLLYAGAKDGLFPKFLGKINSRYGTPINAIIFYAILIFIFSISGGFQQLAILASGALLLIYFGVVLSTIKLRFKKDNVNDTSFKIPGGLIIPITALVAILYVFSNLEYREMLSIIIFVLIVIVIYFLMKNFKSSIIELKSESSS